MLSADSQRRLARTLHHLRRRIGRGELDRIPVQSKERVLAWLEAMIRGHASGRIRILAIRVVIAVDQRDTIHARALLRALWKRQERRRRQRNRILARTILNLLARAQGRQQRAADAPAPQGAGDAEPTKRVS